MGFPERETGGPSGRAGRFLASGAGTFLMTFLSTLLTAGLAGAA